MLIKIMASIAISLITGFLGAWGGAEKTSKAWRRAGIPLVLVLAGLGIPIWTGTFSLGTLWAFLIGTWGGLMSVGYGIPTSTDSGSTLGAFWYQVWREDRFLADISTRGTLGVGYALILAIMAYFKGNWPIAIFTIPVAIAAPIIFGAIVPKEGHIKVFGKILLLEDIYIYGLLGAAAVVQMIF